MNIRWCTSVTVIGRTRLLSFDKGSLLGVKADMEELSAVGEQVFDAECILNKRLRKVRGCGGRSTVVTVIRRFCSPSNGCSQTKLSLSPLGFFLSGKVGVSGEVEGMVIQVSTSAAAGPKQ